MVHQRGGLAPYMLYRGASILYRGALAPYQGGNDGGTMISSCRYEYITMIDGGLIIIVS